MGLRGPKPKRNEVVWSANLAYAIGLLATDGYLSMNGRHIDLTSKDIEQLNNFMVCIGRQIQISTKKASRTAVPTPRVQFSDVCLYDFLVSVGLTPRKSKTIGALAIPEEYFFDFLRGHHDGDGCFYSYFDPRWKNSFMFYLTFISASPGHVYWIRDRLEGLLGVRGHITTTAKSRVVQLKYAKRETLAILAKMYPNTEVMCLSRKRLKIETALRIVGKSLPQKQKL